MSVGLLVERIKPLSDSMMIKAILPDGTVIDVSTQQYVVEGNYHMFAKTNEYAHYDTQHTIGQLKSNLAYEASDSCWRTNGDIFDDAKSDFFDCDVYVVTGDYDAFHDCAEDGYMCYEVHGFKIENDIMYLMCDNALSDAGVPDVRNDKSVEQIKVRVEGGYIVASKSPDPAYPGIDVEFIPDHEDDNALSTPRVLMEKSNGQPLRALIWGNSAVEDYTKEVRFE